MNTRSTNGGQVNHAISAVETMARWTASLRFEDIPSAVAAVARTCLIDTLGVALGGARTPAVNRARKFALETFAIGSSTVLGTATLLNPSGAAFVNGTAAHALDFDDNCYAGFVHGSAVLAPAALASGEEKDVTGSILLTAFIAGAEIEYALGDALTASLYEKGWWSTGCSARLGLPGSQLEA